MKFNLLMCGVVLAFSSGCAYTFPVGGETCTAAHGGDPRMCWTALRLDSARPATGRSYHSAGTMSLAHATCVRPDSDWWFHGAHHPQTKAISAEGNAALMSAYRHRYPRVADYLSQHGSLETTQWTKMKGSDLNTLGVPLCAK